MKIGLVGYQGSGKSTLFHWLTGVTPDPALAHSGQSAMAPIPDVRFKPLCDIYHPKKVTHAAIELVDTPGLSRTHEGNAARMGMIREAGCLVFVVAAFDNTDPAADLRSFDEDLMLADMEILTNRIQKVEETLKKPLPRTEHQQYESEHVTLKLVLAALETGKPIRESQMTDEQQKVTRAFRLLSEKPRLVIVNTADDESKPERFASLATADASVLAVPAGLELELAKMTPEERSEFVQEMGITTTDRDHFIRTLLKISGQTTFFTAGEPEVRTWLLREGGTALEAADGIHTDIARGFIRAEVMTVTDLVRLGSEREIKAQKLLRQEPKDYVVKDDDILFIRFSV
jgi:ribosome-binding ATPase YchF (GTP1/OBG family)